MYKYRVYSIFIAILFVSLRFWAELLLTFVIIEFTQYAL